MKKLKKQILETLQQLKGSGKFASIGTTDFVFPGLQVDDVGEIAFPLNQHQAKLLIQAAHKAPFGKGSQTIVDNKVRSTREIEPDKLKLNNPQWKNVLDKIIKKIKVDLGLEDYEIEANLYKLLIYEEGDFFLPHKDSEKEKGMFGTLVIGLPSTHEGGELVIEFDREKEISRFDNDNYNINYTAFYADCDHEVKPLISGYRICLVYNLIQHKSAQKIEPLSLQSYADKLAALFTELENNEPYIVLLGHQYTPENFSKDSLKLNDRFKAEALLSAAHKAGYYAKMCLVTSYLSGSPAYNGYYGYDEDDSDENAEMEEVYDEDLRIECWLENAFPGLNDVDFEEEDLIASFVLDEDEPIVKESTGYMGNYGPDLMHWYHYGAVMIWSPKVNAELLFSQSTKTQLEWINYFTYAQQITDVEVAAVNSVLANGFDNNDYHSKNENYNPVADWLIKQSNETFLLNISDENLQFYFEKIEDGRWIKLFTRLGLQNSRNLLDKVTKDITFPLLKKLPALVLKMADNEFLHLLAVEQTAKLPEYFRTIYRQTNKRVKAAIINDLFEIEKSIAPDADWVKELTEILAGQPQWEYIHEELVPQLLIAEKSSQLRENLFDFCKEYLQLRVDNKPQPPADWSRLLPDTNNNKKEWNLLKDFIESPVQQVFEYRKNQAERDLVEQAVKRVVIDLKTETIKKGSPHTLRITKTQADYERQMKKWYADVALLEKL